MRPSNPPVIRWLVTSLSVLVVGCASRLAGAADTAWVIPRSGTWVDPTRWTSGVPGPASTALFGATPGGPFDVLLPERASAASIRVESQTLTLRPASGDVAQLTLTGDLLVRGPAPTPTLSLDDVSITTPKGVRLGRSLGNGVLEPGSLQLDAGTLTVGFVYLTSGSLRIGAPDRTAPATLVAQDLYLGGDPAWIECWPNAVVEGSGFFLAERSTLRCWIDGSDGPWIGAPIGGGGGTIEIAFGPSGPPSPGTAVALSPTGEGCDELPWRLRHEGAAPGYLAVTDGVLRYAVPSAVPSLAAGPLAFPRSGLTAALPVDALIVDALADETDAPHDAPQPSSPQLLRVTRQVRLTSSDPTVVAVTEEGMLHAVAPGSASITVEFAGATIDVDAFVAAPSTPPSELLVPATSGLHLGASSADATVVAFTTTAALLPGDTNGASDVYVAVSDGSATAIERVSITADGVEGSGYCHQPLVSANGRFVTFSTRSPALTGLPPTAERSLIKDRVTGSLEPVAVLVDGSPADGWTTWALPSADGRFVAFATDARGLVPGEPQSGEEGESRLLRAYLRDRLTQTNEILSLDANDLPFAYGLPVAISRDGQRVTLFVAGDDGAVAVVVRDRAKGTTEPFLDAAILQTLGLFGDVPTPNSPSECAVNDEATLGAFLFTDPGGSARTVVLRDRQTDDAEVLVGFEEGWALDGVSMTPDGARVAYARERLVPCGPAFESGSDAVLFETATGQERIVSSLPGMPDWGDVDGPLLLSDQADAVVLLSSNASLVPAAPGDASGDATIDRAIVRRRLSGERGPDLDGDGWVGPVDLAILLDRWGASGPDGADLDRNGTVGAGDLAILLAAWGTDGL